MTQDGKFRGTWRGIWQLLAMLDIADLPGDVAALKAMLIACGYLFATINAIVNGHRQNQIEVLMPRNYARRING